eukprot:1137699-Pelagomonas_calceolata.AAC.1
MGLKFYAAGATASIAFLPFQNSIESHHFMDATSFARALKKYKFYEASQLRPAHFLLIAPSNPPHPYPHMWTPLSSTLTSPLDTAHALGLAPASLALYRSILL